LPHLIIKQKVSAQVDLFLAFLLKQSEPAGAQKSHPRTVSMNISSFFYISWQFVSQSTEGLVQMSPTHPVRVPSIVDPILNP
jgi:hypothetical protein